MQTAKALILYQHTLRYAWGKTGHTVESIGEKQHFWPD